jgi:uncharacterized protein with ParB-like and HNH nuclease domain
MLKPERSVYTTQDFVQWRAANSLELTPKFQRRGVWSAAARSFFIDTLIRTMPVPPIYIRRIQKKGAESLINEVIDGQQRVSAILDYIDGKYRLSRNLSSDWAGKAYRDLSPIHRQAITNHSFSTEIFVGITDLEVLEIFARLNTYSVPLNAQELRNGKYFGAFKQSMYSLALEHLEFWRRQHIFSERNIARMLEVELTSELSIALLDGMQDKKKSLDDYYGKFEEEYPSKNKNEKRFREVIDDINDTFDQRISETEFSRAPLFYTLFCAVAHRRFGLPKFEADTPMKTLNAAERNGLRDAVQRLSDAIEMAKAGDAVPKNLQTFVASSLTQTDNIRPRQERLRVLYQRAFSS